MADEPRTLPQSLDAERAVLGGLMIDPAQVLEIAEFLTPEDFYRDAHGRLFRLLVDMAGRGEPIEMLAVVERVRASGEADGYGGLVYVSSLPDQLPSTQNLEHYAKTVRAHSLRRRLAHSAREIEEKVLGGGDELDQLLEFAEQSIFGVTQQGQRQDWAQLSTLIDQEFLEIQKRSEQKSELTGITTGFLDLDKMLAGLQRKDLVVLAARPSMGKTALALNIGLHAARKGGAGVAVFSLEMSRNQLTTRLLCNEARVNAHAVRTGFLSRDHDWPRLTQAAEDLYHLPIFIDDTPAMNLLQIRSRARRLKAERPELGMLIVDYIGLITGDPKLSREQLVSSSSRGLKALAKELDVAVLALAQLNRAVEQRPDKRPLLSDLRESGAIEQDADVIMFIYRDEYYNKETTKEPGVAEVIVAKHRNGRTGPVKLAFQGEFTRFDNLASDRAGGGNRYV